MVFTAKSRNFAGRNNMASATANKNIRMYPFGMRSGSHWGLLFFMNALQVFGYNGSNVTFSNENGIWVNATEMSKPFGKRPVDWLRLQITLEYIEALFKVRENHFDPNDSHFEKSNFYGFVITERGGANPCTWFHEDVAIEYARWLSPSFAIWCNDRIRDILTSNVSKYPTTTDEAIFYGYEKALEKICRQGKLIKKYSKCINELKSQLDYEKEKREQKRIAMNEKVVEDVKEWILNKAKKGDVKVPTKTKI